MPAYSFQKQFVSFVESGEKTHTIRGKRKNRPQPGQTFYAYYAMRTKQCRKLLQSTITKVLDIIIDEDIHGARYITVEGCTLSPDECETLARRYGFEDFTTMMLFWPEERLPFEGDIIHWKPVLEAYARARGAR